MRKLGGIVLLYMLSLPLIAQAQQAYITNSADNTVSVIDTGTGSVVATIPVGRDPIGVVVLPSGAKVYITNYQDHTVSVIDTTSNTVSSTISGFGSPWGIAATPDGTKVYVADGDLWVIDTSNDTKSYVGITPPQCCGYNTLSVAISPNGAYAYVTNPFAPYVYVVDTATGTTTTAVSIGSASQNDNATNITVTPDGRFAYVADDIGFIWYFDTSSYVAYQVGPADCPCNVAITPDGSSVYVANNQQSISIINIATNNFVYPSTLIGLQSPKGIAFTSDGSKAYVAQCGTNTVAVIDTATLQVGNSIPVGTCPVAYGNFIQPGPGQRKNGPVAMDEFLSTKRNTAVSIDLTAGASGSPASAALVGTAVDGTVMGFPGTTVTFTPTKGFTGTVNFQFTLANVNGTSNIAIATIIVGAPPSPHIFFGANDITGTIQPVVVGQPIQLATQPPPYPGQTQSWTLNVAAIVGGFSVSTDTCPTQVTSPPPSPPPRCTGSVKTLITSDFITPVTPLFYWVKPGSYRVVYKYTLTDGTRGSADASFTVEGPTAATITPWLGGTAVIRTSVNGPPTLDFGGLQYTDPFTSFTYIFGIGFTPDATNAAGGRFLWIQTIREDTVVRRAKILGTLTTIACLSTIGLDSTYPYVAIIPDGKTTAVDIPEISLVSPNFEVTRTFKATMYLLWKTTTVANSIPVPLEYVDWEFEGTATNKTGVWSVSRFKPSPLVFHNRAVYPQWTALSDDLPCTDK
jgi:YVTN family beta-propeller protein